MNWSVKLLQKALLMLGKDLVSHFSECGHGN